MNQELIRIGFAIFIECLLFGITVQIKKSKTKTVLPLSWHPLVS